MDVSPFGRGWEQQGPDVSPVPPQVPPPPPSMWEVEPDRRVFERPREHRPDPQPSSGGGSAAPAAGGGGCLVVVLIIGAVWWFGSGSAPPPTPSDGTAPDVTAPAQPSPSPSPPRRSGDAPAANPPTDPPKPRADESVRVEVVADLGAAMEAEQIEVTFQPDGGEAVRQTITLSAKQRTGRAVFQLPKAGDYGYALAGHGDVAFVGPTGKRGTQRYTLKAQGRVAVAAGSTLTYVRTADPKVQVYTATLAAK